VKTEPLIGSSILVVIVGVLLSITIWEIIKYLNQRIYDKQANELAPNKQPMPEPQRQPETIKQVVMTSAIIPLPKDNQRKLVWRPYLPYGRNRSDSIFLASEQWERLRCLLFPLCIFYTNKRSF
jgi:hypothetical protein